MKAQSHTLTKASARRLALARQGLDKVKPFGSGRRAVHAGIQHLGYVQIDTISVTERAHNHILWSRVPDFRKQHLLDLQIKDRKVFEYWAHAAAYLPMEAYRFCIPTMEDFRHHRDGWPKSDRKVMQYVLNRVRSEGPLKSRDFAHPEKKSGTSWWDWKPTKLALQRLFFTGDLMISHREGFQRVYDLAERILPGHIDTTVPGHEEYARFLILNAIRAHGVVRPQEISYLRKGMGALVRRKLGELVENEEVIEIAVKGINGIFYTNEETLEESVRITRRVRLLSPFDNSVIQRERLKDLFGFDYQIEVYVPGPKRKYGYYCLPILRGDEFVGRVDVKAERKAQVLRIVHLTMESGVTADIVPELAEAFRAFATFNACEEIVLERTTPAEWKKLFE